MKRILYANGSILTGDDIAHSVVRYAAVLANAKSADTVVIPVAAGGGNHEVEMLLGPASQLMVEDAETGFETRFDASYLAALDRRREMFENPPPIASLPGVAEDVPVFDEF